MTLTHRTCAPCGLEHPAVEAVALRLDTILARGNLTAPIERRLRRHRRELEWIDVVLVNTGHPVDAPRSSYRPEGKVQALAAAYGLNAPGPVPLVLAASGLLSAISEYLSDLARTESEASEDV